MATIVIRTCNPPYEYADDGLDPDEYEDWERKYGSLMYCGRDCERETTHVMVFDGAEPLEGKASSFCTSCWDTFLLGINFAARQSSLVVLEQNFEFDYIAGKEAE